MAAGTKVREKIIATLAYRRRRSGVGMCSLYVWMTHSPPLFFFPGLSKGRGTIIIHTLARVGTGKGGGGSSKLNI